MRSLRSISALSSLLFLILPHCSTSNWLSGSGSGSTTAAQQKHPNPPQLANNDDFQSLGLSTDQISLILGSNAALASYQHKPDCFRDSMDKVKSRCGQELEMNQEERILAAIALTKCEIYTSHSTSPLECENVESDPEKAGKCVQALSRSSQFWSSYSGYLREVSQLCFAFRRWNEVDSAKSIYKDLVDQKKGLLNLLQILAMEKKKRDEEVVEKFEGVEVGMKGVQEDLKRSMERQSDVTKHFQDLFHNLEEASKAHSETILKRQMEMTSSDLQLNLDSALMSFGRELLMQLEKTTSDSGSELATLLKENQDSSLKEFGTFQEGFFKTFESFTSELITHVDKLGSSLNTLIKTTDSIETSSLSLVHSISSIGNYLDVLGSSIRENQMILVQQSDSLESIKIETSQLVVSISQLVEMLNQTKLYYERSRKGSEWKSLLKLTFRLVGVSSSTENGLSFGKASDESWFGEELFLLIEPLVRRLGPDSKISLMIKMSGILLGTLFAMLWFLLSRVFTLFLLILVASSRRFRPLLSSLFLTVHSRFSAPDSNLDEEKVFVENHRIRAFPMKKETPSSSLEPWSSHLRPSISSQYPSSSFTSPKSQPGRKFQVSTPSNPPDLPPQSQRHGRGRRAFSEPPG